MTQFEFAISPGHNVTSPTNVESVIEYAPHVLPDQWVPYLGDAKSRAGSGKARRDGIVERAWQWDVLTIDDLNTFIIHVWGSFSVASAAATMRTIDESGRYARFNVYADKPHPQENYTISPGGVYVRDVVMPYRVISSLGEHTFEFTYEFTR